MAKKINRDNFYPHLLEKQFNIIELTTFDALFDKEWTTKWTITQKQYDDFRKYSIALIKKTLKVNTNKAKEIFDYFYFLHGLNILG